MTTVIKLLFFFFFIVVLGNIYDGQFDCHNMLNHNTQAINSVLTLTLTFMHTYMDCLNATYLMCNQPHCLLKNWAIRHKRKPQKEVTNLSMRNTFDRMHSHVYVCVYNYLHFYSKCVNKNNNYNEFHNDYLSLIKIFNFVHETLRHKLKCMHTATRMYTYMYWHKYKFVCIVDHIPYQDSYYRKSGYGLKKHSSFL